MIRKALAVIALLSSLSWPGAALPAEPRLVLVANARSALTDISPGAVRRLYLGLPILHDGHQIVPLRNTADAALQELFLQRVLFMSAQAYERQSSAQVFRNGGNRPREYAKLEALLEALANEPWSVTYMDAETAGSLPSLKILAGL